MSALLWVSCILLNLSENEKHLLEYTVTGVRWSRLGCHSIMFDTSYRRWGKEIDSFNYEGREHFIHFPADGNYICRNEIKFLHADRMGIAGQDNNTMSYYNGEFLALYKYGDRHMAIQEPDRGNVMTNLHFGRRIENWWIDEFLMRPEVTIRCVEQLEATNSEATVVIDFETPAIASGTMQIVPSKGFQCVRLEYELREDPLKRLYIGEYEQPEKYFGEWILKTGRYETYRRTDYGWDLVTHEDRVVHAVVLDSEIRRPPIMIPPGVTVFNVSLSVKSFFSAGRNIESAIHETILSVPYNNRTNYLDIVGTAVVWVFLPSVLLASSWLEYKRWTKFVV